MARAPHTQIPIERPGGLNIPSFLPVLLPSSPQPPTLLLVEQQKGQESPEQGTAGEEAAGKSCSQHLAWTLSQAPACL